MIGILAMLTTANANAATNASKSNAYHPRKGAEDVSNGTVEAEEIQEKHNQIYDSSDDWHSQAVSQRPYTLPDAPEPGCLWQVADSTERVA